MKCSSQYLSRNFPCFRGITLPEIYGVIIFCSIGSIVLGLCIGWVIGYKLISTGVVFVIGMVASINSGPKRLAKLKEGKPAGYVKKHLIMKAQSILPLNKIYRCYNGRWSRAKSIGDSNV